MSCDVSRWLRRVDGLLAAILVAGLVAALAYLRVPEELAGRPRVIDGDTIELAGRTLRLSGIDAPEMDQSCGAGRFAFRCGERARDQLRHLIGSHALTCRLRGQDRYGRDLAACEAGDTDLARALVRGGYAVAYGAFAAEEDEARVARRGLWAGPFERPSDWRRQHRPGPGTM